MLINEFLVQFENINIPIHGVRLPTFKVEDSYKKQFGIDGEIDNYTFLRKLCQIGFKGLKLDKNSPEYNKYAERVKYELEIVNELGFVDYFLLVWDVINFCKLNNIPVNYGRGSCAGSIILYLIGVTQVDPIKHDLYFERFISKTRAKKQIINGNVYLDGLLMVDADLDICFYNRHKVIEYLSNKFSDRLCKILTFNTLSSKLLVKECGKIIDEINDSEMTNVTELIPKVYGKPKNLDEVYVEVEEFRNWCDEHKNVYEISLKLSDLIKNKGCHPSALLISFDPLSDSCPTELDSNKSIISSYDMNQTSLFNVKLDVLGLRGVSVVDDVCKNIGIEVKNIDVNNNFIYQQLQNLKCPHGLFQIEADTNLEVARKIKPRNLEELSAVLALARPGALQFVDRFANYTNFGQKESIHKFFDDILSDTGGVMMYQEQIIRIAHKLGFSKEEGETLRRIIGKKKKEEMEVWQKKIKDKILENNLDSSIGDIFWKICEDSANYLFCKSHSVCYSYLAAASIYLKFTYPLQFFLSLLKMTRNEPDPIEEISKIHKEMPEFGIQLLGPHLTKSKLDFSVEGKDIRFGLLSIKGISDKSIEKLNLFCNEYSTKFEVFEAANQVKLSTGILCALIHAGALDGFKQSRVKVAYEAQLWNVLTEREKKLIAARAKEFDYDLVKILKSIEDKNNELERTKTFAPPLIKTSRFETIRKHALPFRAIFEKNKNDIDFANWYYENLLLGYTYGKTLKDIFLVYYKDLKNIKEILQSPENEQVKFVSRIPENAHKRTSKAGNKYVSFDCKDESGTINVKIFTKKMETALLENDNKLPQEDNIIIVTGVKKGNEHDPCIFAESFSVQDKRIFTKYADLKSANEENEKNNW